MANAGTHAPGVMGDAGGLEEMSISGHSLATHGTLDSLNSTFLPVSPIAVRREALAKSVFPRQAQVDVELLERVRQEWEERATCINFNAFCHDIYTQNWLGGRVKGSE